MLVELHLGKKVKEDEQEEFDERLARSFNMAQGIDTICDRAEHGGCLFLRKIILKYNSRYDAGLKV